jgi:hypothetical protein
MLVEKPMSAGNQKEWLGLLGFFDPALKTRKFTLHDGR